VRSRVVRSEGSIPRWQETRLRGRAFPASSEETTESEREGERAVAAKELLLVTRTVGERDFPQNSSVSSPPFLPPSSPSLPSSLPVPRETAYTRYVTM